MTLASMSQIKQAFTNGYSKKIAFQKGHVTITPVGALTDLWSDTGNPSTGAYPNGSAIYDKTTTGALQFPSASDGNNLYLTNISANSSTANALMIIDRLWSYTIPTTINGNVDSPNGPTRYTNGNNNILMAIMRSGVGNTSFTLTVSYTNQNGVSGQIATCNVHGYVYECSIFALAAGDTGVQSVQSWTLSTPITGGTITIVMSNIVSMIPLNMLAEQTSEKETLINITNFPLVDNNACLSFLTMTNSSSLNLIQGTITLLEG